jgi:virginiamycin A acetyltransferase
MGHSYPASLSGNSFPENHLTSMNGPAPDTIYPLPNQQRLVYLKNIVKNPNIIVGDYTYYDDVENPENFERHVLYHFDFEGDKLIIGKFCSIAAEVKFIMNGANHRTDWFTNYPFPIFGNSWEIAMPDNWPNKGDTIIGNDVWLGYDSLILPGIQIGDGAIIAARAVVTRHVAPYTIVGGNPAVEIRKRFPDNIINELLEIRWWNWPVEKINRNLKAICNSDINALRNAV